LVYLTPYLPLTEGEPTQCGFCPDADIACNCGDTLYDQPQVGMQSSLPWPRDVLTIGFGVYQEYVSRLLLLETTVEMQVSIAATIAKLETIKNLNKRYNPYTEVLEEDMVEWIREMQYVNQKDTGQNCPRTKPTSITGSSPTVRSWRSRTLTLSSSKTSQKWLIDSSPTHATPPPNSGFWKSSPKLKVRSQDTITARVGH
jgi:hypothetical protein